MSKKLLIGFVLVYVVFAALDTFVNVVLLAPSYESVSHLFRPSEEMKLWVIYVCTSSSRSSYVHLLKRV